MASSVDSAETLSRWRAMMTGNGQKPNGVSSSNTSSIPEPAGSSSLGPQIEVSNPVQKSSGVSARSDSLATQTPAKHDNDERDSTAYSASPVSIPSVAIRQRTPTPGPKSTSPSSHPISSPSVNGLCPPLNSPQVQTSTPAFAPGNTHDEDVGAALTWFVQNLKGRPLSESIWAPKNAKSAPLPLRVSRAPSGTVTSASETRRALGELTPVNAVQPDAAVNDTFTKTTFPAFDSILKVSDNTMAEGKVRSSALTKMMTRGTHLEQGIFATLEKTKPYDIAPQVSPPATMLSPIVSPSVAQDGSNISDSGKKKENINSSTPKAAWIPPHLRVKGKAAQRSADSHSGPSDGVILETKTAAQLEDPSIHSASFSPATETTPSLAEIGQNLLKSIADLECNGCLGAEAIASLYDVHNTIQAQLAGNTEGSSGGYPVPPQTDQDPNPPIKKRLVKDITTAEVDDEATKKETADLTNAPASTPSSSDLAKSGPPHLRNNPNVAISTSAKQTSGTPAERANSETVSVTPAAASKTTDAAANVKDNENRERQTWFTSWGKQEERDRSPAKIRTVTLTQLPYNATASFVASLVYGGAVEFIQMRSTTDGILSASVRFMGANACKQYYDDTSNGIVYKKNEQNHESVVFVGLGKDVDVVGGLLQQYIDTGVTRCVRAVGVDEEWGIDGLKKIAERKNRKVEGISDSETPGGARSVVFRFCKIEDAVRFKSELVRDQDWEHCNVHFAVDPCATATGVHFDD